MTHVCTGSAADKGKAAVPGPALAGHAASDVVRLDEGCVPPAGALCMLACLSVVPADAHA
jgi:hypothetical protein